MSSSAVTKATAKMSFERKMTHKYFLRKLAYLTQTRHSRGMERQVWEEKKTVVENFKVHFAHYSKERKIVDAMIQFAFRDRISDDKLWTMCGQYLLKNFPAYDLKSLIHLSNILVKYSIPSEFFPRLSGRLLAEDLSLLSPQEIALVVRQAKSEALLHKVKAEGRIHIDNELDLFFFTEAFLRFKDKFPDMVELLQNQVESVASKAKNVQTLCNVLRAYAEFNVALKDSAIRSCESAFCREDLPISEHNLHEILITMNSPAYFSRASSDFWSKFESKLVANVGYYRITRLLSTISRSHFLSEKVLTASLPVWMDTVDRLKNKEVFREGMCAIAKFPSVPKETVEYIESQIVFFRQHFTGFDVATILRAIVIPGWYTPTIWKVLTDRFFSPLMTSPIALDKSMVYFALKSLAIDQVKIPNLSTSLDSQCERLKEQYEKMRMFRDEDEAHCQTRRVLSVLGVQCEEFQKVAMIYAPNFVLRKHKIAIFCQKWPSHLIVNSKRITPSMQMVLRHLNKSGFSVVIVAKLTDLETHLKEVLAHAQTASAPRNFQIV